MYIIIIIIVLPHSDQPDSWCEHNHGSSVWDPPFLFLNLPQPPAGTENNTASQSEQRQDQQTRELTALERRRLELPMILSPGIQVNTRDTNTTRETSSKRMPPSGIFSKAAPGKVDTDHPSVYPQYWAELRGPCQQQTRRWRLIVSHPPITDVARWLTWVRGRQRECTVQAN